MKPKHVGVLTLVLVITLAFASCSDDKTTEPSGDTTAPFVVTIDPALNATAIATDQAIVILFNEPMDPATAAGNVTLSSGSVTTTSWTDTHTLEVNHTAWAEGAEITVTVETGFKDAAGNALAASALSRFWTESTVVSLLTTIPEDLSTGVARNDLVQMLFSHRMDAASVLSATTATDLTGSQALSFTVDNGDGNWILLAFDSTLPATSEIEIVVGTGAQSQTGSNLASEGRFKFTTGTDTDTDPPMLVSVEPANGSVISPNTGFLRFTFNEALNTDQFVPNRIGAQFLLLIDQVDATWSNNNSVVTVPLPTPLPDGLPIVVHFASYQDVAGNVQTTPIEYEVVVSGTPDYFPAVDGAEFVFDDRWVDKDSTGAIIAENTGPTYVGINVVSGTEFDVVDYQDNTFTTDWGWDSYEDVGNAINFTGFVEKDSAGTETYTFVPPVTYIKLPWAVQSWNGVSQAQSSGGNIDVTYTMDATGPEDIQARDTTGPIDGGQVYWIGCRKLVLTYQLSFGGQTQSGSQTFWFAPTIGVVQEVDVDEQGDGGTEESESYLQQVNMN